MDNIEEIDQNKRVGNLGAAFLAVIGGLAAGVGAALLTINSFLAKSLRKSARPGFEKLDSLIKEELYIPDGEVLAAKSHLHEHIGDVARAAHEKSFNAIRARYSSDPLRAELTIPGKPMNKSFKAANAKFKVDSGSIMREVAQECAPVSHHGNEIVNAPSHIFKTIKKLTIGAEKERLGKILDEVPSGISIGERIKLLSGPLFDGGQKSKIGLAFSGAAVVAAGAIYLGLKTNSRDNQRTASIY